MALLLRATVRTGKAPSPNARLARKLLDVAFGYDAAGQATSLTDANGRIWRTTYDALGSVATTTDPLNNVTTYVHDTAGLLTARTDGRGITTTYRYDTAGRLASLATPSASITTTYDRY